MSARRLIAVFALAMAIAVSTSWEGPDALAGAQAKDETPTTGRVVGSITPPLPSGFHVRLSIPDTTTEIAARNSDSDGHFALEGVHPGTYQLDISALNGHGGCPYIPWTKKITIHSGRTTTVKAKIELKSGAVCE
jgi:hypothetical protein